MMKLLFNERDLAGVLDAKAVKLSMAIGSLSEDRVLNTSHEDLSNYYTDKYRIEGLKIDESKIQIRYGDAQIDVSNRIDYFVRDRSGPFYITGTRIVFYMPFTGDQNLFYYYPSTYSYDPPQADVRRGEVVFTYDRTTQDAEKVRSEFERDLNKLKNYLEWISGDVEQFNSSLRAKTDQLISARREKLLNDRGLAEQLGFPLRRRDKSTTYVTPKVKRRVVPQMPTASTEPFKPEPALSKEDYDYILSVLENMVLVMERSPGAFKDMREEDIRTHFLVQLNGHFEGQATGETFNYEGKTDILIRTDGRNIFIAECKFWNGPSGLKDALNQLQGYISWRDTKAALLIFNRGTNMSTVLEKIPEVVRQHPRYKAEHPFNSETGFRYVFGHRDDPNREVFLTVLVFNVPT